MRTLALSPDPVVRYRAELKPRATQAQAEAEMPTIKRATASPVAPRRPLMAYFLRGVQSGRFTPSGCRQTFFRSPTDRSRIRQVQASPGERDRQLDRLVL